MIPEPFFITPNRRNKGFINPQLLPVYDENNEIRDIQVNYGESYAHQMLRYSAEYGTLI